MFRCWNWMLVLLRLECRFLEVETTTYICVNSKELFHRSANMNMFVIILSATLNATPVGGFWSKNHNWTGAI